jgi:hypothetical protein
MLCLTLHYDALGQRCDAPKLKSLKSKERRHAPPRKDHSSCLDPSLDGGHAGNRVMDDSLYYQSSYLLRAASLPTRGESSPSADDEMQGRTGPRLAVPSLSVSSHETCTEISDYVKEGSSFHRSTRMGGLDQHGRNTVTDFRCDPGPLWRP